ncbi:MAG TPA: hypothetical protein VMV45_02520 [Casimicrobiaceae bacterium]|nr:hypothetical protein [Casimicrobiaceae bacterium]
MANPSSAAAALLRELSRVQRLNAERVANPILAGGLDRLALWQSRRLQMTYADLAAQPRYCEAIGFFCRDLYGPGDFSRRDDDLARIVPTLARMLPERVIDVLAQAVELNALSRELDRVVIERLRADQAITVADYCRAYRRAGNFPARNRQIALIGMIGRALDRTVAKPWVRASLAMMHGPARLAGLQSLQDLLERGFSAFRHMGGATEFLQTIDTRENAIHEAIVGGSNEPFGDPLLASAQSA